MPERIGTREDIGRVPAMDTLLGVWAHPDDETYLAAGLMALAAQRGARVVCVTATKGEEGSWDEEAWPPDQLGEVRAAELLRSLEILGVSEHHWLGYRDGECAAADPEEATGKVRALMAEVQPDAVVTFGPEGMTGHDDHRSVSRWTSEAFRREAPAGGRLYHAVYTPAWAEEFVPRLNRFNVFFDPALPPVVEPEDLAVHFRLPQDVLDLKLRAIQAHVSQVQYMLDALGSDFFRRGGAEEFFVLAAEA